ncbi:hypothetical protein OAT84_03400 [Gammaproteobacteria bacterium]|nr:hypothetical protein [Gammaproteobacteria bacterium]
MPMVYMQPLDFFTHSIYQYAGMQGTFLGGVLIGYLIVGRLLDIYSQKKVEQVLIVSCILGILGTVFIQSKLFLVFLGIFASGVEVVCLSYLHQLGVRRTLSLISGLYLCGQVLSMLCVSYLYSGILFYGAQHFLIGMAAILLLLLEKVDDKRVDQKSILSFSPHMLMLGIGLGLLMLPIVVFLGTVFPGLVSEDALSVHLAYFFNIAFLIGAIATSYFYQYRHHTVILQSMLGVATIVTIVLSISNTMTEIVLLGMVLACINIIPIWINQILVQLSSSLQIGGVLAVAHSVITMASYIRFNGIVNGSWSAIQWVILSQCIMLAAIYIFKDDRYALIWHGLRKQAQR